MSNDGRSASVTHGVQGLGARAAKARRRRGFPVARAHLRVAGRARSVGAESGVTADERDGTEAEAGAEGVGRRARKLGPLAVLVDNAGANHDGAFHATSRADRDGVAGSREIGRRVTLPAFEDAGFITGATPSVDGAATTSDHARTA